MTETSKKRLLVRTYGCQMNVYDSARMTDVLAPFGYEPTDDVTLADMVILNTCHIREKASEKVFSELGRLRDQRYSNRQQGRDLIIAVAGCVAQAEGAVIMERAPWVDIVLGPQTYHRLPEMVARAERAAQAGCEFSAHTERARQGVGILDTEFPVEPKFDHLPKPQGAGPSAFLSIQEGCDKFCTFCVVPYTRGAEYSRPARHILDEARHLIAQGVRELTLLGQNVNAYHGEAPNESGTWGLGRLIFALAEIEGLHRLRYTTSHPRDVDDDLIRAHAEVPALMPFLHLPVQSGSDRILRAMNRGHTQSDYRSVVTKLRDAVPNLALSSDFIVGFPHETQEDFEETMRLVRDVGFIQTYSFKYSPRPGTPAASMERHISEDVKSERLEILQTELRRQQEVFNSSCLGQTMDVLFDRPGRYPGQLVGRSPFMQPVHISGGGARLGDIMSVQIVSVNATSMAGCLLKSPSEEQAATCVSGGV